MPLKALRSNTISASRSPYATIQAYRRATLSPCHFTGALACHLVTLSPCLLGCSVARLLGCSVARLLGWTCQRVSAGPASAGPASGHRLGLPALGLPAGKVLRIVLHFTRLESCRLNGGILPVTGHPFTLPRPPQTLPKVSRCQGVTPK